MTLPRKKRPFGRFIPSFERLETRTVPTGNVNVSVIDGVLHLVGDDEANQVRIVQGGANGVSVQPIDDTTINGQADAQTFDHVSGLYLSLRGGDNVLQVDGLNLGQAINISGMDGNNNISVTNTHIHNYLALLLGAGDDTVTIDHVQVRKKLDMNMGGGDDTFNFSNSRVGKKSYIDGNGGDNTLNSSNNHLGEHSQVLHFGAIHHGAAPTANNDTATVDQGGMVTIDVAANDTTPSGTLDLTSIVITTEPTHGTLTVNDDGTVDYTNDNTANTSDSFQYTIKNSQGITSNVATVTITITQSQNPIANNDTATVARSGMVTIVVSGNDVSPTGTLDLASIVITQQPTHGTVTVNNNGTVDYTNNGDPDNTDTFRYTIADTDGNVSNEATVTVTITGATNQPPVAVNDHGVVALGGMTDINLAANDTDADGTLDLTSIMIGTQPQHGTVTVHDDGTVTYTNNGDAAATDTFTYTIKDNQGATSNVATVTITVDTPPVANDDTAFVAPGGTVAVDVAANDTDADGTLDLTSIMIGTQPQHGTATVNPNGTVTYTNTDEAATTDSFTYTIKDNNGVVSNIATVNITIDNPPIANDDTATVAPSGNVDINVALNDTDIDGTIDLTSITITHEPLHGTVTVHVDGTVTYTNDGSGTSDSFRYTIKDNSGATSNEATVSIAINQSPVAVDDSARVNPNGNVDVNVLANDTDADGTIDPTTVVITQQPLHGTVSVNPTTGVVTYTNTDPAATSDSFQYTVADNHGAVSNAATVSITVNDAPVANPDGAVVALGGTRTINLAGNDTDGDGTIDLTSIQIVQQPQHGTVTVNNDGTVTYHNDGMPGFTSDSFTYTIRDNEGAVSNEAPVSIGIGASNIAPVAVADFFTVHSGLSANFNVAANDFDVDGTLNLASIVITVPPSHGMLTVNADGTVTYVNDGLGATSDTFSYTIADDLGAVSSPAQVFITVPPAV